MKKSIIFGRTYFKNENFIVFREKYNHVEKQKEYLQKGLEDAEKNLRELIQSKRS